MSGFVAQELDFYSSVSELMNHMRGGGVLCCVAETTGKPNVLTLGWGLAGPSYHDRPVVAIAVSPLRYSWHVLEERPEFVLCLPTDDLQPAVEYCGSHSGREVDKFAVAGLTTVHSVHVRPPSIVQCPVNIECRTYASIEPPHMLLTPEHRQRPVAEQHTIYFAEVLGAYRYVSTEGGHPGSGWRSRDVRWGEAGRTTRLDK